jgi:G3E family GTPase
MAQVEVADVIILNKCDLVPAGHADSTEGGLHRLNPVAKILRAEHAKVKPAPADLTRPLSEPAGVLGRGVLAKADLLPPAKSHR